MSDLSRDQFWHEVEEPSLFAAFSKSRLLRLIAIALIATAVFVGPTQPASFGEHDDGDRNLQVFPERATSPIREIHTLTATITATSTPTVIHFESETGPPIITSNNPTSPGETVTVNDAITRSSPDMACTIESGDVTCTVSFTSGQSGTNTVRAWIDHERGVTSTQSAEADPNEGRISDDYAPGTGCVGSSCLVPTDTTTDCVPPDPVTDCQGAETPGRDSEPDSTDVVEKGWTAVPARNIDLQPKAETNPVGTQHLMTATVTDASGQPVSGTAISWQETGPATFSSTESTTDINGQANATITSNSEGTSTVTSTITDDDPSTSGSQTSECSQGNCSDTANKTWEALSPTTLTLRPASATNELGTTHTVTAKVEDQNGDPLSGVTVRFTVTGANEVSGTSVTDGEGDATFSYKGDTSGTDNIHAYADSNMNEVRDSDEPEDTATKEWQAPGDGGPGAPTQGYWMAASDGGVFTFGKAKFFGSTGAIPLNSPIVGMDSFPSGEGYWMVAADGGVFAFGQSRFFGSTGSTVLNRPIVGMAATPSGAGYWFVASDGGVFAFGDATFQGSTGSIPLNSPVVGIAATPSGKGYWLFARDGGVFAFGDAKFKGSTGSLKLNSPIVGADNTPSGGGYWEVASDGGVFAFPDASFRGSTGSTILNSPIVGMSATPSGSGYWFVGGDGGIFSFGDAQFHGSTGSLKLNRPIVGIEGFGS